MSRRRSKTLELPLCALKDGESGIVVSVGEGRGRGRGMRWGFGKRLLDMGLTPGTRVTIVKSAPFHGPVEILVRGSRLALGRGVAERILVEKTAQ